MHTKTIPCVSVSVGPRSDCKYLHTHTHTHIHNVHAHKQYSTHMWAQTYMLMHVLILKARHLHVDGVSLPFV